MWYNDSADAEFTLAGAIVPLLWQCIIPAIHRLPGKCCFAALPGLHLWYHDSADAEFTLAGATVPLPAQCITEACGMLYRKGMEGTLADILITVFGVIVIILLWIMLYDSNRFIVVRHEFTAAGIRKNCRAVVLADLHNKCFGKDNERLLAAIREQKPDMILVAGDIPTAKPGKKLDIAIHLMEELAKSYPVYYGNGNHEQRLELYPERYGDMHRIYDEALRGMGVQRLVNAHIDLEEYGIAIYGAEIDKFYYQRFGVQPMEKEYLDSILGSPDGAFCNILLAHNPDYFPQYAAWGADLVLAGHVHGGMVRIPFVGKGVVSPNVRFFPKYDGGLFQQDRTVMLLSRGLGMHTIPIRLFNPGELLVVDFEHKNPEGT